MMIKKIIVEIPEGPTCEDCLVCDSSTGYCNYFHCDLNSNCDYIDLKCTECLNLKEVEC